MKGMMIQKIAYLWIDLWTSLRETAKILSNLVNKVKLKYLTCWQ